MTDAAHNEFRILSPTAILGYGFPVSSFDEGLARGPHLIAVDAGSTDPGPFYLGSGKSFTDRRAVKRDLRHILTAGVRGGIPVAIGSAGGAGAAPHLAWCRAIVEEIAREEGLAFNLAVIPADVPVATVTAALEAGELTPLEGAPEATAETIAACPHIVAQMGVEPFIEAFRGGADVVLAGRAYDPAVFAALPLMQGYDAGPALHMGKILECAAIAADPGSGADAVLGTLVADGFELEALGGQRRFTRRSTVAHSLYEKSDPTHLPGPGGALDLSNCSFEEVAGSRVRVRGSRFVRDATPGVKLEGARRIGFRTVSIAGSRDPVMIRSIRTILGEVRERVEHALLEDGVDGNLHIHVYGSDGVMGSLEPDPTPRGHEIGILLEAIGATQADADTVCSVARSTLLHYGYANRISTAGNLAFPLSPSDIQAGPAYAFVLYHLVPAERLTFVPEWRRITGDTP